MIEWTVRAAVLCSISSHPYFFFSHVEVFFGRATAI